MTRHFRALAVAALAYAPAAAFAESLYIQMADKELRAGAAKPPATTQPAATQPSAGVKTRFHAEFEGREADEVQVVSQEALRDRRNRVAAAREAAEERRAHEEAERRKIREALAREWPGEVWHGTTLLAKPDEALGDREARAMRARLDGLEAERGWLRDELHDIRDRLSLTWDPYDELIYELPRTRRSCYRYPSVRTRGPVSTFIPADAYRAAYAPSRSNSTQIQRRARDGWARPTGRDGWARPTGRDGWGAPRR